MKSFIGPALAFAFSAFTATNALASGPDGTVTFQGTGFIEAVNSTCTTDGFAVGDYYSTVYRYSTPSATVVDVLDLFTPRSAYHIASNSSSKSLNGSTSTLEAYIDSHGGLTTSIASSTVLSIGSAGGNPTVSAINLKVVGTINDFENNAGCTITFHADLVARPN